MTIKRHPRRVYIVAAVTVLALLSCASSADKGDVQFSEAETTLWLTDQLQTIAQPAELLYEFERRGTYDSGFTDTVKFIVEDVKADGMKAASVEFFTGERRFEVPSVESTNVNPVLKIYLQGDVYEMNRLTDPEGESRERWRYFHRRIKFALAESAKVENTTITIEGKALPAKRVSFKPYMNDPKRSLFEQFADKIYTVIVSDQLPGYLYQINTTVPGSAPNGPPLIEEVLQFVGIRPSAS